VFDRLVGYLFWARWWRLFNVLDGSKAFRKFVRECAIGKWLHGNRSRAMELAGMDRCAEEKLDHSCTADNLDNIGRFGDFLRASIPWYRKHCAVREFFFVRLMSFWMKLSDYDSTIWPKLFAFSPAKIRSKRRYVAQLGLDG